MWALYLVGLHQKDMLARLTIYYLKELVGPRRSSLSRV